jgi:hypothetical protein
MPVACNEMGAALTGDIEVRLSFKTKSDEILLVLPGGDTGRVRRAGDVLTPP